MSARGIFLWNYFETGPLAEKEMLFEDFFSILKSGDRCVQESRTIWAISVKVHKRNISVKLFSN